MPVIALWQKTLMYSTDGGVMCRKFGGGIKWGGKTVHGFGLHASWKKL
jgi:hypothetical protein